MTHYKPNYNNPEYNEQFYREKSRQTESYLPQPKEYSPDYYSNSMYTSDEVNGKDFLIGALVGGVIGAAAALFLAPKTGKELRENVSTQAVNLKDKTAEFSTTAKEKTSQLSSQLKEQSTTMMEKVKSKKGTTGPMDDGTASSEGEEPIDFVETIEQTIENSSAETPTSQALKEAVEEQK
ncbi:YtxH domain-containing protein [Paenisporosarcina cavernae]|uniref:YtxH domain-containing protein n=1 Tax=Paenisporosarcina cavernae TaxID=2320858 RepID=A0A385YTK9_9BACL|nr:YtxH domain-containing protein [Paenisporosarcina cavernae]AYC29874.1 YtxH domain-containing protein [Paenisporosarcina cavernae]